jgi:hypothetical protein
VKTRLAREEVLALLAAGPARIGAATNGLPLAHLRLPPQPNEWSANDVLAHLRACADVWGDSIRLILSQDSPTFRAVNPRTWIDKTDYLEQEFHPSFQAYTAQRAELFALLSPLAPELWARSATVTGAGKPLTRTVHSYAEGLAIHERPHLKQIERIVKGMGH